MALLDAARSTACINQLVEVPESGTGVPKAWSSSPLHMACDKGLHEVTKAMLSAGAKADSRDADGATALLHACRKVREGFIPAIQSTSRSAERAGKTTLR